MEEEDVNIASDKAIAIINSCEIGDHFDNAIQYVELFHTQFKETEIYNELLLKLKSRKIELGFY